MATLTQYTEWIKRFAAEDSTDTSNPLYPDDEITAAVNSARYEWCRRLGYNTDYCRSSPATVTATTTDITLPSTFLGNLRVRYGATTNSRRFLQPISSARLDELNPNWRDETTTEPSHFIVKTNADGTSTFAIVPTLSASVASGCTYTHTTKPTALSAGGDIATEMAFFPELDMLAIPSYALTILYNFEGGTKDDQVQKWSTMFEAQVERGRAILNRLANGRSSWKR